MTQVEIRRHCRAYAERFIDIQRKEFKRLGVLGEWDNPYLTMAYAYEATIARELGRFFERGSVIRSKKPIYWCASCRTALAEAEVEYHNHVSPSIYVKFPLDEKSRARFPEFSEKPVYVLIWTTTPWTIPANLAITLHPDFDYVAVSVADEIWILAEGLAGNLHAPLWRSELWSFAELSRCRPAVASPAGTPSWNAKVSSFWGAM